MSIQLKIKSKHLSEEIKIIRHEEDKQRQKINYIKSKRPIEWKDIATLSDLQSHRTHKVRTEVRATFLARAYLAGKMYSEVEQNVKDKDLLKYYIVPRVEVMVNKYRNFRTTEKVKREDIINWIEGSEPWMLSLSKPKSETTKSPMLTS